MPLTFFNQKNKLLKIFLIDKFFVKQTILVENVERGKCRKRKTAKILNEENVEEENIERGKRRKSVKRKIIL